MCAKKSLHRRESRRPLEERFEPLYPGRIPRAFERICELGLSRQSVDPRLGELGTEPVCAEHAGDVLLAVDAHKHDVAVRAGDHGPLRVADVYASLAVRRGDEYVGDVYGDMGVPFRLVVTEQMP